MMYMYIWCIYVYYCVYDGSWSTQAMVHVWKSENNFVELGLSFYTEAGFRVWTQDCIESIFNCWATSMAF